MTSIDRATATRAFACAAAADETPVSLAAERVGLGGGGGGLTECTFEVAVALAALPDRVVGPDWMVRGDNLAHETRCPAVGNWAMPTCPPSSPPSPPPRTKLSHPPTTL